MVMRFHWKAVEGGPEALRFFSLDEPLNVQVRVMKEVPNATKLKMHFRRAKECVAVDRRLDYQLLLKKEPTLLPQTHGSTRGS